MSVDLSTEYLGLDLEHPIVASAGPLTANIHSLLRLEAAGAAAVVLPSLYEEEITRAAALANRVHSQGAHSFAEASTFLPELAGPDAAARAVELVETASNHLQIPVIASLSGTTPGGWLRWAEELADAGADALELNVHLVTADPNDHGPAMEHRVIDLVRDLRDRIQIPLALKIGPYYSALAHFASELCDAGADGLVLFNRYVQPDIDLDTLEVRPSFVLSNRNDLRLPLRWVAVLHGTVGASLALSGGVHDPHDAVKGVLAGADVVMSTSALLEHGAGHIAVLRDGLARWLESQEYRSVREARGSVSRRAVPDPDSYERAYDVAALQRATYGPLPGVTTGTR